VRFISNPSTGKQGFAIAEVAAGRGHRVVLVSGPVMLQPPAGVELVSVISAAEMAEVCKARFDACDAAILTAAVCDYRPPQRLAHKLQKKMEPFQIMLEPTEDIAAALGRAKGGRLLVGFAMNDADARRQAERKLHEKNCDVMVLNGLENVGADHGTVHCLLRDGGWQSAVTGSKHAIARHIVELVESMKRE
jgi:phosphopantothenoylcysteine decarboxylase/phosphopantothenate--cysteine ligase